MPLQQGEVQGYDFNRSVVEFTMLNQGNVILCAISTAAMDDLEGRRDVRPDQRIDQFMRLREVIEERASRKFFEEKAQADRPVVLRANDFDHDGFIVLGPLNGRRFLHRQSSPNAPSLYHHRISLARGRARVNVNIADARTLRRRFAKYGEALSTFFVTDIS